MPVSPHAYEAEIMKIIVETKIGEIFSGLLNHADADFMTITNKSPAVFFWGPSIIFITLPDLLQD